VTKKAAAAAAEPVAATEAEAPEVATKPKRVSKKAAAAKPTEEVAS
jgi:hypothetical protein